MKSVGENSLKSASYVVRGVDSRAPVIVTLWRWGQVDCWVFADYLRGVLCNARGV